MDAELFWKAASVLVAAAGFGFGVVKWVQRSIDRVDAKHDRENERIEERLSVIERDGITRAEFTSMFASLRVELHDGFRSVTDRIDRVFERRN